MRNEKETNLLFRNYIALLNDSLIYNLFLLLSFDSLSLVSQVFTKFVAPCRYSFFFIFTSPLWMFCSSLFFGSPRSSVSSRRVPVLRRNLREPHREMRRKIRLSRSFWRNQLHRYHYVPFYLIFTGPWILLKSTIKNMLKNMILSTVQFYFLLITVSFFVNFSFILC